VLKDVTLMAVEEINRQGRRAGQETRAGGGRPGSNWAAVREKGAPAPHPGQGRGGIRLWTSVSRKSVLPVFEELNGLLFYPVQYEGEELSRTSSTPVPPQPAGNTAVGVPHEQGRRRRQRWVLLGTDYVYPRTTNKILALPSCTQGVDDKDIDEKYTPVRPLRLPDHRRRHQEVARRRQDRGRLDINGDSNVPFYKELGNQGLKRRRAVVAFSVGEEELRGVWTPSRSSATSRPGTTSCRRKTR